MHLNHNHDHFKYSLCKNVFILIVSFQSDNFGLMKVKSSKECIVCNFDGQLTKNCIFFWFSKHRTRTIRGTV